MTSSAPRPSEPLRADDVLALTRSGALLIAAGVAQRLLEWFFANRPILPVVIGAFLLDLWSQRIGARWLPERSDDARWFVLRRWLSGFGLGIAIGLVVPLIAAAAGAAHIRLVGLSTASLALGSVRIAAQAFRDELLYRGIPLALIRDRVPAKWAIAFSALLSVAPLALDASTAPEALFLGALSGVFYALTWKVGPGGLVAWSAHTGWLFVVEIVLGGPFDVEWRSGSFSGAAVTGWPAYLGAIAFAGAAFILYGRKRAAPE